MQAHAGEDAVMELHEEEARRALEADWVREGMLEGEEDLDSLYVEMVPGRWHAEVLRRHLEPPDSNRHSSSNRARATLSPAIRQLPPPRAAHLPVMALLPPCHSVKPR